MPPTALIGTLESLRRRVRVLSVMYGVGILVAIGAGLLLGTVLLDYLLNLLPIPRIILMLAALACLANFLARWVVRPAMTRLRLSDVAGKLEHAFPDFKDRLRSSVDFLTKGTPGSEVMKNRVVAEAAELAGRFDLSAAVQTKPVWESFAAGGGAILILILLAALAGRDYLSPAFSRLIYSVREPALAEARGNRNGQRSPVARAGGPAGGRPDSVDQGRQGLARGAGLLPVRRRADADRNHDPRSGRDLFREPGRAGRCGRRGNGQMIVWTESGDDATAHKTIAIVQRLSAVSAELMVQPPPYT